MYRMHWLHSTECSFLLRIVQEVGNDGKEKTEGSDEQKDVIDERCWDEYDLHEEESVKKNDQEDSFQYIQTTHLDIYRTVTYHKLRDQEK